MSSFIIDGARSPIGVKTGKMIGLRSDDLSAVIVKALLERNTSICNKNIEDVIIGCAFPEGPQGMLMSRAVSVLSDLPIETAAKVVNRFCGSSMDSIHQASQAVISGDASAVIAGGVEDMFSVPMGGFNPSFHPELFERDFYIGMGETAENLANELGISRADQEDFAIESHTKALNAREKGYFDNEIVHVHSNDTTIIQDEGPREPDIDKIRSLDPAFDTDGTVTAATSSPVSIGGAMTLVVGDELAKLSGKDKFLIRSRSVSGVDWRTMGAGPLPATDKALERAGMTMDDIDAIELNEAFAAQSLYVIRKGGWDRGKVNLNGGAIALGHPLGCSGARIIVTLMNVLSQRDLNVGLATMCIGSGQGIATVIERV